MINTIIDFKRLPVDKDGNVIYDYEEARHILETYQRALPDRQVIMIPSNISVWEDVDINILKYYYNILGDLIKEKEQEI